MIIYPNLQLKWPVCLEAVRLIAEHESCRLRSYPDPISKGKPWTCGWGETEGVGPNVTWTQEYADQRFCDSLTGRVEEIRAACPLEPNEHELGAMASLQYNIGHGAFLRSSVLKLHNAGKKVEAADAFDLYVNAKGPDGKKVKVPELVRRRKDEARLYLKPVEGVPVAPMPQDVAPPQAPVESTRIRTGSVAIVAGAVATAKEVGENIETVRPVISQAKGFLGDLGIPSAWIVPGFLIGVGIVLVWHWLRDRREGGV